MLKVLVFVLSVVGGFLLMLPLAWIFDVMRWPVFHSWGLAHGSFIVASPALALLSAALLRILLRIWASRSGESRRVV
jgi:hypothetical protein